MIDHIFVWQDRNTGTWCAYATNGEWHTGCADCLATDSRPSRDAAINELVDFILTQPEYILANRVYITERDYD